VRSEAEFRGERFWPSGATEGAGRAGHIPGALNLALDAVTKGDGTYASVDALGDVFPDRLADGREIITYCTIGNRASIAWFVLSELLGRRGVRVYDGSWAEWGLMPATPIEVGARAPMTP
jgi:thiosulfate/3-mercaptopyruvate sulfurtransferase